ncbi:MAG TPA: phosphoribosylformylglycinamidine cyclo-ligase [Polyangia bacterium]|nr:phosphoribosylformylglycinamidine cyclo-ligase [Polyangia bacterium]
MSRKNDEDTKPLLTYRDAGVDIDAGDELVERIKPHVRRTFRPEVMGDLGGFGALFAVPRGYADPVLVSGTDGVGTKLKVAFATGRHDTIGIDLVAMCVNDIAVSGAEPLFFLDYFASGKLDVDVGEAVVKGIAEGCKQAGCALIGGETAELPGMYADGEYDLAGFAVGIVERAKILDGARIRPGDTVIGVASSGLHSNGYSLARRVLSANDDAEMLLTPTRIYVKAMRAAMAAGDVRGFAHITGGGLVENPPRVLADGQVMRLDEKRWPLPTVFQKIAASGVARSEMRRTFNCGLGLVAVVAAKDADKVRAAFEAAGEQAWIVGDIAPGSGPARVEFA